MEYLIALFLIACSALFSGLTLGYFTLDTHTLKRQAALGDSNAAAIYPIRLRGNYLLTTLLFGNVAVNTALSIYLGTIASGVVAGVVATSLIFLFGEIIPQAVISRHALMFGAKAAPVVRILMVITSPVSFPIAYLLDRFLGEEMPRMHSKQEIMQIVSEHEDSEHSPIDEDEERIVHGALKFSHQRVLDVMTPLKDVVMFSADQRLTHEFFEYITDEGFSRYPIYQDTKDNIVGMLYAKDLLTEDDNITIIETEEAFDPEYLRVKPDELLDIVLAKMLKQKRHIALVYSKRLPTGVITLEDIIEEIIQFEIEDEDD